MKYTEEYYRNLNYANYLDRQDRYDKTARELTELLTSVCLIEKNSRMLDFGCAVGFLSHGIQSCGYTNVFGYDISEWATEQARSRGVKVLNSLEGEFEIGFFLDVLEHMTDEEILEAFSRISVKTLIARIPVSVDGKDFALGVSRVDPTHVNCKTKQQWVDLLAKLGYSRHLKLNLLTIYDSEGVFCLLGVR